MLKKQENKSHFVRRTYTPSSSFSHSLTAALVHSTSLLPSTSSVLYPSTLHPENKPQWELQSSSWLHWWLHSGSTDHIRSNLSCSTAHFQTAEGVSCSRVLRVRRLTMQWFQTPTKKKCALFTLFEGCSDVPLSSWLQAPWIQNLQQRVGTPCSPKTLCSDAGKDLFSWAYSVNIFI